MKQRLDLLLVEKGVCSSREKARWAILAGEVLVEGIREDKPGTPISVDSAITVKESSQPYASRGGLKLEKALKEFRISLKDRICVDAGASTGGFTDCMLKHGAAKVYAIDVGYGQLAWVLRNDPRVVSMERTNIRYVLPEQLGGDTIDFAAVDVSFISLSKVIPAIQGFLRAGGDLVCLVKPQFEAGRAQVGKHGVVRDPAVHTAVLDSVFHMLGTRGFSGFQAGYSPIRGPKGNIEFLAAAIQTGDGLEEKAVMDPDRIRHVVEEAHAAL